MPPRGSFARPGFLGALLVAATLALAIALAYQAVSAAASHRAAVETALVHHASTAAWRFAREARISVDFGMMAAGDSLQSHLSRRPVLPGPEVLKQLFDETYCDCVTAAFAHTFVRFVRGQESLDLSGEPLSERARDDLRERMRALAVDVPLRGDEHQWRILAPGTPRLNRGGDMVLLWRITDRERRTRAVYGMVVDRGQIERTLASALQETQFFPPQVVSPAEARSLVRVEVAGTNGVLLFAAGPETARFAGSDTLGADFGSLTATATINPAGAQVLVAGGLPPSRVPLILALLVLAVAVGGAAGLLLRREHRLARLREDFVSGVSHELRTPLTQIRVLSELLETDGFRSSAERTRAVGVIHRESLRLTNLVDNILEFTRLRRAAPAREPTSVALGDVVREVADTLRPLIEAQGSRLELSIAEELDVRGDRDAVSRVLRNLIENAAKYGPPAQTIGLSLDRSGSNGGARITVDDEGPGIPAHERARIWQPYYRLDRDRNAPVGGSGLGLSVVADLVRELGGSVSVTDAPGPGPGARFMVELPGLS